MAFKVCDTDKKAGLTVTSYEVRNCMEDCVENDVDMSDTVMKITGELDFGSSDLNGDGVLLFDEWKTWANGLDG